MDFQHRSSPPKLCVCGRSETFPLCDNSHEEEGWHCAITDTWQKLGFCASYRYQNLARKLASHYHAALIIPSETRHVVETMVTIVDDTDIAFPLAIQAEIQAHERVVVTLGTAGRLLQPLFPDSHLINLGQTTIFEAFKQICTYLDEGERQPLPAPIATPPLRSAFISHAVKDEPLITPAADYLRRYFGADLFLCADSIPPGVNWHESIITALQAKDVFVMLLSAATLASHFCSFEIGMAYALQKPLLLLSLDGSRPPTFVQHLQTVDIPRLVHQKPWLEHSDMLIETLIQGLNP